MASPWLGLPYNMALGSKSLVEAVLHSNLRSHVASLLPLLLVKAVTKIHLISREENKDLHFSMEKCHIVGQACGMGNTLTWFP